MFGRGDVLDGYLLGSLDFKLLVETVRIFRWAHKRVNSIHNFVQNSVVWFVFRVPLRVLHGFPSRSLKTRGAMRFQRCPSLCRSSMLLVWGWMVTAQALRWAAGRRSAKACELGESLPKSEIRSVTYTGLCVQSYQ